MVLKQWAHETKQVPISSIRSAGLAEEKNK